MPKPTFKNLVGFGLSGQDNGTHMFPGNTTRKCPTCGYRVEFSSMDPSYTAEPNAPDYSTTYDGHRIVTARFRGWCLKEGFEDLLFSGFRSQPNFFDFQVQRILKFDAKRRRTRFENLCPDCGNYESIVGAAPSFLLVDSPLPSGFYRSDLLFGSGNEKHPLIFVGPETKLRLEGARLSGLEFSPAYGIE